MRTIQRPALQEYHAGEPIFADLLPDDGRLLDHLLANLEATKAFLRAIPEARLLHRYAAGKWTIKEAVVHVIDLERIYAYRALRFARADGTALPGFDGDKFVDHSGANARSLDSLLHEFEAVRGATVCLAEGLDEAALLRSGHANGKPVSVRALLYHIAGHEIHHRNLIREKYLAA